MTAPLNHRSTDTYPVTNNTRWNHARTNGEAGVEVPESRASVFRVKPPAIPECPAVGESDVAYNLKVDADGFVEWEADQVSTPVQSDWNQTTSTAPDYIKNKPTVPTGLPNAPAAAAEAKDYKLHVAIDGTVTWVEISG